MGNLMRRERRGLRLWNVGLVLALVFVGALTVAGAVFLTGWELLGARGLKHERRIDSKTLFDLVKLAFGVVAGAGALVALVVAYRRQRVDEDGARREATRLHTERFTTAVSQLGDDSAAVRLGGVHALAGLADDAPTNHLRQTCIDVLCAYLRLPYTAETDLPEDATARHAYQASREVRHTIIRIIRDHTALGPEDFPASWQGYDLDFTGVVFDGGDFTGAVFAAGATVSFRGADFSSGTVSFREAEFAGGTVGFQSAGFSGGTVDFGGTLFSGGHVYFGRARFSDGQVHFGRAEFCGATVGFGQAEFSGGTVDFRGTPFSGGTVYFDQAEFTGSRVCFDLARFAGSEVGFDLARFLGGEVGFGQAQFSGGRVDFDHAEFTGGTVGFEGARFSGGRTDFGGVQFSSGAVNFRRARFSGGTVDFSGSGGPAPRSLLPVMRRLPLPDGLRVPARWHPSAP